MGFFDDIGNAFGSVAGALGDAVLGPAGAVVGAGYNLLKDVTNRNDQVRTQQTTWDREDTAVQRRAADLQAAGLSPTLAAGSSASSVSTQAPQLQDNPIVDVIQNNKALADISVTRAQKDYIDAQKRGAEANAEIAEKDLEVYKLTGIKPGMFGIGPVASGLLQTTRNVQNKTKEWKDSYNSSNSINPALAEKMRKYQAEHKRK